MRDVLGDAAEWLREGRSVAIATVVGIRGSAPRELGASMIVAADGEVRGNVSGGCVEGAVIDACLDALRSGRPGLERYGIAEDALQGVGLMCGGDIEVLVRPVAARSAAAADLLVLGGGEGSSVYVLEVRGAAAGSGRVVLHAAEGMDGDAWSLAGRDRPELLGYDADGCRTDGRPERELLVIPFGAAPRLVIVGAVQHGVALAALGAVAGYAVTVVDPRSAFAAPARFPAAEVVVDWPDRWIAGAGLDDRSAVCVLSHDEKIDVPAVRAALASPAGYVGAMGSRRTHEDRLRRLVDAGVSAEQLDRLRSPLGLDLGGRSPEETALSILAEIVAVRYGREGGPLTRATGAIHSGGVA